MERSKEEIIHSLELLIIDFFEKQKQFENKFILNRKIIERTSFKNKPVCSEINIEVNEDILKVFFDLKTSICFRCTAKVLTSNKEVKNENIISISSTIFKFSIFALLELDVKREVKISNFSISS